MGAIHHHVVLATTFGEDESIEKVKNWIASAVLEDAKHLFVFGRGTINNYVTLVMFPDGSKEGWEHSKQGDAIRAELIAQLKAAHWDWVEVSYGGFGQRIERGNCD